MSATKVLVVEDEGLIANDIADRLRKDGYQVTGIASSAKEVFGCLSETSPDLVLMDIRIKGDLDGIETAQRVRDEFNLPIIFLTAHADRETLERAKITEPFGYLVKPFRQINLASSIEMALYKHRSEQELKQREAWLSTVLLSSPNPTVITDRAGAIRFLNPLAMALAGRNPVDGVDNTLIGHLFSEVFLLFDSRTGLPPGDLIGVAIRKESVVLFPRGLALKRAGLSDIEVDGEIAPSCASHSNLGAVITLRDVTHRVREEQEICQEQKMLAVGRMAGGIAHDFNNLLTVILGHCEQLMSGSLQDEQRQAIESVLRAGQAAATISSQLLALSRKQIAPRDVLRCNEIVDRVASLLRSTVGIHIEIATALTAHPDSVRANPSQLDQALVNLILNARDAMPEGGKITLSTSNFERETETLLGSPTTEQYVRITVADTGCGINAEAISYIFEPFYTTKPLGKGTGLGLAMVYSIVKDADGELNVFSTPNEGSTFEILLHAVPDPIQARRTQISDQEVPPRSTPATLLLVEDESMLRAMTHNYFERKGYNLLEAASGEEALQISEMFEDRIDVLITDVLMPKMDGPALATCLAMKRPNTKTIFVSGYPSDSYPGRFLQKPFTLAQLHSEVQKLIAEPY